MHNQNLKTRKITYDSSNFSGESNLSLDEAKDLFSRMDWSEKGNFYTLLFGNSFLQFVAHAPNEITVEIMLDEDEMLVATKKISMEEELELIEYYFENDTIGDISSFEQINL